MTFVRDRIGFIDHVVSDDGVGMANVFGLGDIYVAADPDYFERILVSDEETFEKTEDFETMFGDGVVAVEGAQWEKQRDALDEFFYPGRIRSYADKMVDLTQRRIDRWSVGDSVSMHEEMSALALDNIFGTLFERNLDIDGDEELRQAANDLNRWFKPTSMALPQWVPTPSRRRFEQALDRLRAEGRSLLDERRSEELGDDLLSELTALHEDGDAELTDDEIVDQFLALIFAGHDTTALALTYAFHCLGTHPEVRQRFHEELDEVLGDSNPGLTDIGELKVTKRIVNETLRAYPPVHTIARNPTRDVELGGYHVPEGARLHISIWGVHHDEAHWTDPEEWRPSRWRDTSPGDAGYAFVPFGAGPRACLGRRFSVLEATLVLATIGQQYHLEPLGPLELAPEATTQPANEVPARVDARTG